MLHMHVPVQRLDAAAADTAGSAAHAVMQMMVAKERMRSADDNVRTAQKHLEVLESLDNLLGGVGAAGALEVLEVLAAELSNARNLLALAETRAAKARDEESASSLASAHAAETAEEAAQEAADEYAPDTEDDDEGEDAEADAGTE